MKPEFLEHMSAIKNKNSGLSANKQAAAEEVLLKTIVRMHFRLYAREEDKQRLRPLTAAEKGRQESEWQAWPDNYKRDMQSQVTDGKEYWNFDETVKNDTTNKVLTQHYTHTSRRNERNRERMKSDVEQLSQQPVYVCLHSLFVCCVSLVADRRILD